MQDLKIEIKKPCEENWSTMIPSEKGKFCLNSQKNVIDFTKMSDAQILNTISVNEEKQCGRFHKNQLNRTLSKIEILKKNDVNTLVKFRNLWK